MNVTTAVSASGSATTRSRLLLSACTLLLALLVYFWPGRRFPNSADDWSYLYQARLFASGHLYAQDTLYDRAHPLRQYVGTNCVTDNDGRRFSKYPPGWPLLLALGTAARAEWLVAPLLGAVLVFLVLGDVERRVGRDWVKRAWLLIALCAFLTFTFQSFRSHTATMVCLFAAFVVYDRARSRPSGSLLVLTSGVLMGYASLVRYVDWIPLAAWISYDLLRRRRLTHLVLFGAGFALLAGGNLLYDALLSGHPFLTPTVLNDPSGPHDRLVISWRGFIVTGVRVAAVLYALPPVMILLSRRYWRQSHLGVYAVLFLMSVAVYFFYVAAIGGPGPRYLGAYMPFLVIATVDAWRWLHLDSPARARWLWRAAIVAQVLAAIVFAGIETRRVYERKDLDRTVAGLAPGRTIVLLREGPRGETWADFTRNPPVLSSADVLYFGWGDGLRLDELIARFPGRPVYVYRYPGIIRARHAGRP